MTAKIWSALAGLAGVAGVATYIGVARQPHPPAPQPQPAALVTEANKTAPAAPVTTTATQPVAEPAKPTEPVKTEVATAPVPTPAETPKPQLQAAKTPGDVPAAAATPTPDAAGQPAAKLVVPTFDIVRVEPSGDTVVAGQGMPGATIELMRDGAPFARAVADVSGQWAIVPPTLPKGAAELMLRGTTPDGRMTMSEQAVVVRVPEKAGEDVVVVLNSPSTPSKILNAGKAKPAAETQVAAAAPSKLLAPGTVPVPTTAPEPVKVEPPTPETPKVEAAKPQPAAPDGQIVVAEKAASLPQAKSTPAVKPAPKTDTAGAAARTEAHIRTVEADESGRFFVTGTAQPGADIRIYLNDTAVTNVTAAADGSFSMTIEKGMKPGDYRVRVDDVESASGKVLTRAEVPFVMEAKNKPAAPVVVAQLEEPKPVTPATRDLGAPDKPGTEPAKPTSTAEVPAKKPLVVASRDIGVQPLPQVPSAATTAVEPAITAPASPVTAAPAPATKPVVAPTTDPAAQQVAAAPVAPAKEPAKPVPAVVAPDPAAATPAAPGKPALQTRDIGALTPAAATPQTPVAPVEVAAADPGKSASQAVIAEIKTTTIVHGDNLWRLSRKIYGRGIRYTWIYDANTNQIRDPHWIYPGQIFVMPEKKEL